MFKTYFSSVLDFFDGLRLRDEVDCEVFNLVGDSGFVLGIGRGVRGVDRLTDARRTGGVGGGESSSGVELLK